MREFEEMGRQGETDKWSRGDEIEVFNEIRDKDFKVVGYEVGNHTTGSVFYVYKEEFERIKKEIR